MSGHQIIRPLILSGGFPCQDASKANPKALGLEGERTGLFFEMARMVGELEPEYVFLENVFNLLNIGWERVLTTLADKGYHVWYTTLAASQIGYPYQGKRLLAVAFGPALGLRLEEVRVFDEHFKNHLREKAQQNKGISRKIGSLLQPETFADFHAATTGLSPYLVPVQLHAAGNAIPPDFSEIIFQTIKEFHQSIIKS